MIICWTTAFQTRYPFRKHHVVVSVPSTVTTKGCGVPVLAAAKSNKNNNNQQKPYGFVDEILDALDTMAGVSPLSETDLKDTNVNWVQRATERNQVAPPKDALQKPSVLVFFTLLGLVPSLLFLYAVQSGAIRPLNL